MDYSKHYLLSDIPTEFFYSSKEHKTRAMMKKIKRAGIEIVRCRYGYRWIKKSDYHKLRKFLTKPDLKNKLLKHAYEKNNPPLKPSIDRIKHYYDVPDFYNKDRIESVARALRIKPSTIRARYRVAKWDIDSVFEKPYRTHYVRGDFFKMSLSPYIDEFGEYQGQKISDIAKKLGLNASAIIDRIKRGWSIKDAFTAKKWTRKKDLKKNKQLSKI